MKLFLIYFACLLMLVACSSEPSPVPVTISTHNAGLVTTSKTSNQTPTESSTATKENRQTLVAGAKSTRTVQILLTDTALALTPSPTIRPSSTIKPTNTASPVPSATLSPTPTPTLDVGKIVTFTPAALSECPEENAEINIPALHKKSPDEFEIEVLDILNAGGLRKLLAEFECGYSKICIDKQIASADLTGDNVPELVIGGGMPFEHVFVFGCQQGQYKTFLVEEPEYDEASIANILDMNLNGMSELVIRQITCHWCLGVRVFEWQENHFESLVWERVHPASDDFHDLAELSGYSSVDFADVDGNKIYEIILEGGIPSWSGGLAGAEGPYRSQTVTYAWNGKNYTQIYQQYEPPRFRFEAVQDGDVALDRGEYEKALSFYQNVIFNESLSSWTYDAWYELINDPERKCCSPPDINNLPFNGVEYAQLAAYSRYRIMLLHLLRGWDKEAQVVYDTLLDKFPIESDGYLYAQLATEFWDEYQVSRNFFDACDVAISFAEQHEEILTPLGNNHGMFSQRYEPEQICPFR